MTEWQVGQRWVHGATAWGGVGVVRYVENGRAAIRWGTGGFDICGKSNKGMLSPAPDLPRVYVMLTTPGNPVVFLSDDRCVHMSPTVHEVSGRLSTSTWGKPLSNGSWDHHEITGTPEADECIRQAEAYFAEKAKPAPERFAYDTHNTGGDTVHTTPAPAPLPTPEEVASKIVEKWDRDIQAIAQSIRKGMESNIAAAIRTDRERRAVK